MDRLHVCPSLMCAPRLASLASRPWPLSCERIKRACGVSRGGSSAKAAEHSHGPCQMKVSSTNTNSPGGGGRRL